MTNVLNIKLRTTSSGTSWVTLKNLKNNLEVLGLHGEPDIHTDMYLGTHVYVYFSSVRIVIHRISPRSWRIWFGRFTHFLTREAKSIQPSLLFSLVCMVACIVHSMGKQALARKSMEWGPIFCLFTLVLWHLHSIWFSPAAPNTSGLHSEWLCCDSAEFIGQ